MNIHKTLAILITCILIVSCKSESQDKKSVPKNDKTQIAIQPRYQIYLVTVDNLRVRKGAQKSTKVIDRLKETTIVYGTGEVSDQKEKITLRGTTYNEAYHKINYNGNTGWVYGGALYKIYDESEEDSFTETFEGMVTQITSPNKSLLEKGKHIISGLQKERSGSEEWNDILYLIAEQQINNLTQNDQLHQLTSERSWTPEEYNSAANLNYDMNSNRFAQDFSLAGMKFSASEGIVEPITDPKLISKIIGGPFSPTMKLYLDIKKNQTNKRFFNDGGLSCPLSVITSHIIDIEKLLQNHPHFSRNNDLKRELTHLHHVLVNGTDNSPAYNPNTNKVEEEWLKSWNQYLSKNPNGLIANRIKKAKQKS